MFRAPVAVRSVAFWIVCRLLITDLEALGNHSGGRSESTLTVGLRRDMGWYEALLSDGLTGLGMEDTVADLQTAGMSDSATERLNMSQRYRIPEGPKWRK